MVSWTLFNNKTVSGPFLCVAPLSTLPNWEREFKTFAPEIPIVLFHASKQERPKLYKLVRRVII